MGLRGYIVKRVIYSVILVLFVLTLNFIIFELMPGNPMEMFFNPSFLHEKGMVEELFKMWGFDQPLHVRYITYLYNMLTWRFGYSYLSKSLVSTEMTARLSNTLLLVGSSTVLSIIIGVFLGVIAAYKRGGIFDGASVIASLTTYALPSFWMGMMFLLVFSFTLHWFPSAGTHPPEWAMNWPAPLWSGSAFGLSIYIPSLIEILGRAKHLFLPVVTLTLFSYGGYLLVTRSTMLETLTEDYVVTARAKGLKERTVLFKHALKNASLPIITNVALSFGFLLTGAIITEQVFTYPGLGYWTWSAISFADYPVLQAIFFVIALCVIIANFVSDLVYGLVDPRIKYG
jgi:peptide/nickel transport system permease protein